MRTDDLIARLSAGTTPVAPAARWRRLGLAALAAVGAALALLFVFWGLRPDIHQAMRTGPFLMKAGYTIALGAAGFLLVDQAGRPGARTRLGLLILGAAVAAIGVLAVRELMAMPMNGWRADIMGHSARQCPMRITILSAPAFALALWALRRMAPTRLSLAGAAAGLLGGGLGATVYGLYCQETAAAFTAAWYTLGVAVWAAVGAVVGPRVLRW